MSLHSGATEILPGLWLGDLTSAQDTNFLKDKQVHIMFNCSKSSESPNHSLMKGIYHLNVLNNYNINNLHLVCQQLDTYCHRLKQHLCQSNILIYCENGYRMAPVFMTMYLMKTGSFKAAYVIKCLRTKRVNLDHAIKPHLVLISYYQRLLKIT
jgi:hypothetical protein